MFYSFLGENGGILAPISDQKSMPTSKGRISKNCWKTNETSMIFQVLGVELGIKNRSQFNRKLKPKMKCLLASILGRFWWILRSKLGRKIEPRSIKNRFKKASKKWWKKEGVLEGSGWGNPRAGDGVGWPRPPPFSPFSKNQTTKQIQSTEHRGQKEHLGTPGAQARWRILVYSVHIL